MKWTSWTRNYTVNLLLQSVVLTIIIVLRNNWLSFKCINQHTGSYFHLSASQLHSAVFEHTKYVAQLREEKLISHNPDTACTKTRHIDNVHYNHNKPSTVFKPSGACEGISGMCKKLTDITGLLAQRLKITSHLQRNTHTHIR